ncbi:hypothetical protein CSW98_09700 [Vibrio sp. HA2012]|uniref:hypothetical protein n=1 Tax=Vibrio sp. HA2012 TaxID=1971595 RepID=UPI000C2C1001|nr:hypothetical protein [Vibrio sp. HA2012]PJC86474.1 hypothetical protein CSW98_09700 [Vibrio sp. HA2012]
MDLQELKSVYHSAIIQKGSDPERGTTFEKYWNCFNSDSPPQNATQLKLIAGGESAKARIAFEIISNALKPKAVARTKAGWYVEMEQSLFHTFQKKLDSLWDTFDREVQELAKSRSQIAEGKANQLQHELSEIDAAVDELEKELLSQRQKNKELQDQIQSFSKLEHKLEQLNIRLEEKQQQIDEKNKQIEEVHQLKQDLALCKAELNSVRQELASNGTALERVRSSYEEQLTRNGRLEGELNALKAPSDSVYGDEQFYGQEDDIDDPF